MRTTKHNTGITMPVLCLVREELNGKGVGKTGVFPRRKSVAPSKYLLLDYDSGCTSPIDGAPLMQKALVIDETSLAYRVRCGVVVIGQFYPDCKIWILKDSPRIKEVIEAPAL